MVSQEKTPLRGQYWGQFNIFLISNMDSGTKRSLSKFAGIMKLHGAVNVLEERDAIQRDLDRLERWDCANLMKFNRANCKVHFFTVRVVRHWNRLPREAVDAPSLKVFKARLDRALSSLVQWKVSLPMVGGLQIDGL
ncbi:rna-directed dna polymerase from mobile element jockey-like [Willisornis vidua]|uniref:Rna-directed dna polymerase from mobile element jockey-like n=1 Tax=Willisornis vidua TaxID=1566151 RepID=A0ABQ9DFD9_9PASS|nr:rna-directed dna polymerase from mobile element jockey-like [Willisornis vidua]